jgi:hypothetical protein
MKSLQPPAIPYIGLVLNDLLFIYDGFCGPDVKVDFQKYNKSANIIQEKLGKFQKHPFEFDRDNIVLSWLKNNQNKVSQVKDSFISRLSDQVEMADARDARAAKKFWK